MQKPLLFPLSLDFDHHFQFLVDELVVNLIYREVLKRLGFQSQNPPRLQHSNEKSEQLQQCIYTFKTIRDYFYYSAPASTGSC